jgi:hypothetical protein
VTMASRVRRGELRNIAEPSQHCPICSDNQRDRLKFGQAVYAFVLTFFMCFSRPNTRHSVWLHSFMQVRFALCITAGFG